MVAWMNREALALTAEKNQAVYFSSLKNFGTKGEESGHFQTVYEIRLDCDEDVIILQVEQHGGIVCTGRESCFYRKLTPQGWEIVDAQLKDPTAIYGDKAKAESHDHAHTTEQVDVLAHLGQLMQERKQAKQTLHMLQASTKKASIKFLKKSAKKA
jgi:phosphoribosyl-ATP pyrophosphohydrolase/phosphoribosyl-AMP cyclohydrolase